MATSIATNLGSWRPSLLQGSGLKRHLCVSKKVWFLFWMTAFISHVNKSKKMLTILIPIAIRIQDFASSIINLGLKILPYSSNSCWVYLMLKILNRFWLWSRLNSWSKIVGKAKCNDRSIKWLSNSSKNEKITDSKYYGRAFSWMLLFFLESSVFLEYCLMSNSYYSSHRKWSLY